MIQPLFAAAYPLIAKTTAFTAENGILENIQVFTLFFIVLISGIDLFRHPAPERKLFSAGLLLLSISMILRELDVEKLPVPAWVAWIGSGAGRDFVITTAWISLLGFCACKHRLAIASFRSAFAPGTRVWFVFSAVLLLLGMPFDHKMVAFGQTRLVEELLECGGYLSLLAGVCASLYFCGFSAAADTVDQS